MIPVEKRIQRLIAIAFIWVILFSFFVNDTYGLFISYAKLFKQQITGKGSTVTISRIEDNYSSDMLMHSQLINTNGLMADALDIHSLYNDMNIYVTDDRYLVTGSKYTTTDYEVEETVSFRDFLEQNGINLIYVNEPVKYVDDGMFEGEFGLRAYSNSNMDMFLDRIENAGVNVIDLRDNIIDDGMDVSNLFYRTDHHWTVPAGLWAAGIMAEGLNRYCGYDIDVSMLAEERFTKKEWEKCWLGEQGRKLGETYVGLDNYTELKPDYYTSFTFKNSDGAIYNGTFDDFVDESVYNTEKDVYDNESWHYSYKDTNCVNNNVKKGKVLIIGDSYNRVTHPFMALQIHELDSLVLRDYDDSFSLRDYIISNGYDTVIIAYAQFMLGAHDDPSNDNYRMFCFDH